MGKQLTDILHKPVVRYVAAGILAFIVELVCILLLHKAFGFSAEVATAIAFWIGLPASFLLQKIFAFRDYQKTLKAISGQALAYAVLVAFNYAFTLAVVAFFPDNLVVFSRSLALIITTAWNYVVYRYMFNVATRPTKAELKQFVYSAVRLKNKWVNLALLGVPVVLFCVPMLMSRGKIAPGDPDYYFQIYEAFRRSILEFGQFPSWNPWVAGGIPLFANIQFAMVSLQAPFVLLFGAVVGFKIAIVGYGLIGFYGFRKLFKDGLGAGTLKATLLAYIPIFSSFFVYRVNAGHFTFLMLAFVPWLIYYFLKRKNKWAWLGFALIYSIMVWSAPHYTTIMAAVVVGFWFAFELIRRLTQTMHTKLWPAFWEELKKDTLFFAKAGGVILALCAYRMFFVAEFIRDHPRLEDASNEPFTGVWQALYSLWGPDQYGSPPALASGYGWTETATYIGIGTAVCLALVGVAYLMARFTGSKNPKKTKLVKKQFSYPLVIAIALLLTFAALGMGDFGEFSPYRLLNHLPVFDSMRVATRWLAWAAIVVLVIIAIYKGARFKKAIVVLLFITVLELFIVGARTMGDPYTVATEQYRPANAPFDQQFHYRTPRPAYANDPKFLAVYAYDENLLETTRNNYGQVIAGDSLVDTRQPNSTIRCGENQSACQFISANAVVSFWSPNKIVLTRTAPGPININMNPGRGWTANGVYIFKDYKVVDPLKAFIVEDPSPIIVLEYAPKFSPNWLLNKIGL